MFDVFYGIEPQENVLIKKSLDILKRISFLNPSKMQLYQMKFMTQHTHSLTFNFSAAMLFLSIHPRRHHEQSRFKKNTQRKKG